jgi:heme/copper-type cytochrome/quinol oxidase subunit 3
VAAVYAARREARSHTALALTLVGVIGVAIINAQAFIYTRMELPVQGPDATAFNTMFYALTGTFVVLGRTADREILSAHALYWYFLSAVFFALWFVVYVTK